MTKTSQPVLQVAAKAAIIDQNGRVLIVREAATDKNNTKVGLWGLVGGRLDPGEPFLDGLNREVLEETGLSVEPLRPLQVGEWSPLIGGIQHQIIAIFMLCKAVTHEIKLSDEHSEYAWVEPSKRQDYSMMEPDCFVVDAIRLADRGEYSP
jgi:8-oxo-dGTP diphosphatase